MLEIESIDADVLVVGGGFAGLWAAIRAREFVEQVVLVDKGKVGKSGCSTLASGVQSCIFPDDDLDALKKEYVERGDYLPDQDWLDIFCQNQAERLRDYLAWGAPIEKDPSGRVQRAATRGCLKASVFMFHGRKFMDLLSAVARSRGIRIIDRVAIGGLLTSDGRCPTTGSVTGAMGIGTRTGQLHVFTARATVMAAGGMFPLKANRIGTVTGDAQALVYEAGGELKDMEFCSTGNINCWARQGYAGGINMFQGNGAKMVNARGDRFMPKYDPVLAERAALSELFMAYTREVAEEKGPVYFDMRHLSSETVEKLNKVVPHPMKLFRKLNIDLKHELIENSPAVMVGSVAGEGGISIGTQAQTTIPGLYAAGAATANPIMPGAPSRTGGVATASCNVMGYVAGESAAKWARGVDAVKPDAGQIAALRDSLLGPLGKKSGLSANELRFQLLACTVPYRYSLVKHESRIRETINNIQDLKDQLDRLAAPDPHELVKVHEMRHMLLLTELSFWAALDRHESRARHYREEYPFLDNIDWLKHIVLKKQANQTMLTYEPLPFDRWKHLPPRGKLSYPIPIFLTGTEAKA